MRHTTRHHSSLILKFSKPDAADRNQLCTIFAYYILNSLSHFQNPRCSCLIFTSPQPVSSQDWLLYLRFSQLHIPYPHISQKLYCSFESSRTITMTQQILIWTRSIPRSKVDIWVAHGSFMNKRTDLSNRNVLTPNKHFANIHSPKTAKSDVSIHFSPLARLDGLYSKIPPEQHYLQYPPQPHNSIPLKSP